MTRLSETLASVATFAGLTAFVCIAVLGLASYSSRVLAGLMQALQL